MGKMFIFFKPTIRSVDSGDRWTLPSQAVEALADCLRDECDEVVMHYAVKVQRVVCVDVL